MRLAALFSGVALSDLLAIAGVVCGCYGLALLHPAAPWIGASVGLGYVAVKLGEREAASSREDR